MTELKEFVDKARAKGLSDEEIRTRLIESGWEKNDVNEALDDLVVPTPPSGVGSKASDQTILTPRSDSEPIAVVQKLSLRGFEYSIMFITLGVSALSLAQIAQSFVTNSFAKASSTYNYGSSNSLDTLAITLLIVSFPIFVFLFLRLKKAELYEPKLRKDTSRRKLTQLTQLVTFLVGLGYVAYFIFGMISPNTDSPGTSTGNLERLLHTLVALIIAGGIFGYYWRDDHQKEQHESN